MSTPMDFSVRYNPQTQQFTEVFLGSRECAALHEYLLPRLESALPDFAVVFDALYLAEDLGTVHVEPQDFRTVAALVMQACDDVAVLTPHKAALKAALEEDPRWQVH